MHPSLAAAAEAAAALPTARRVLVAVDGPDGAGKTTFADELAPLLDRPVVRATIDAFHHPRAVRYRRGRESPIGFYRDSFDLEAFERLLLTPFAAGEDFCRRTFDHAADRPVEIRAEKAPLDALLLVDGIFLHRQSLRSRWDLSILLDVSPRVAAERLEARDGSPARRRHLTGQQLYRSESRPAERATLVLPW